MTNEAIQPMSLIKEWLLENNQQFKNYGLGINFLDQQPLLNNIGVIVNLNNHGKSVGTVQYSDNAIVITADSLNMEQAKCHITNPNLLEWLKSKLKYIAHEFSNTP